MGSCVSSNENSAKLNRKSNKGAELEDVQIELNMCEKRLADMANKVVVLHSKLKFTKVSIIIFYTCSSLDSSSYLYTNFIL